MPDEQTTESTTETPVVEGKTFTQDDVDKIVGDRLARERDRFSDYDDVKARASQVDDLTAKLTEATSRAETAELGALRSSVAMETGVPLTALTAVTEDELKAQAASLIEWRGSAPTVRRDSNSSGNSSGKSGTDVFSRAAASLRSSN